MTVDKLLWQPSLETALQVVIDSFIDFGKCYVRNLFQGSAEHSFRHEMLFCNC